MSTWTRLPVRQQSQLLVEIANRLGAEVTRAMSRADFNAAMDELATELYPSK